MLCQLNFEVHFAETGGSIKGDHGFQTGLSAITGPNESGKSMRLEMIRYALWGTAALRRAASSYGSIKANLTWQIGDHVYEVERTLKGAKLYRDGDQIATGTAPVNAEIKRIFGYDLKVFDMANAVLQGQVEALSNMQSTDRKTMVDKVIGLDTIDDIIKDVAMLQTAQRQNLENLNSQIIPNVVEPEVPEGYDACSGDLEQQEGATWLLVQEKQKIEAKILALNCDHPGEAPVVDEDESDLEDLYALKAQRDGLRKDVDTLKKDIERLSNATKKVDLLNYPLEHWIAYTMSNEPEDFQKRLDWEMEKDVLTKLVEQVPINAEDVTAYISMLECLPTWKQIKELEAHQVTCPECEAQFALAQSQIDDLKKQIPQSLDVETVKNKLDHMVLKDKSLRALRKHKENLDALDEFTKKPEPVLIGTYLGTRDHAESVIEAAQHNANVIAEAITKQHTLVITTDSLKLLEIMDFDLLISKCKDKEEALRQYETNKAAYDKFQAYIEETKDWLKNLEGCEDRLKDIKAKLIVARQFENELQRYKDYSELNNVTEAKITSCKAELEELVKVRKALTDLKPRVKTYLVPSLNRVASNLLSQMTNGQRNVINVNEEFDIWVDNQHIDSLSGSGKAVANLAIRIALGTVLTSKVFSVLLADEVDASMDSKRAAYTAECLRNLTNNFKQVVLVSHQEPQADHYIKL